MNIKENVEKIMNTIKMYLTVLFLDCPIAGFGLLAIAYMFYIERETFQMLFSILAGFVMYFNSML